MIPPHLVLWDDDFYDLPGSNYWEWFELYCHDYDEVDRLYINEETQGGE